MYIKHFECLFLQSSSGFYDGSDESDSNDTETNQANDTETNQDGSVINPRHARTTARPALNCPDGKIFIASKNKCKKESKNK